MPEISTAMCPCCLLGGPRPPDTAAIARHTGSLSLLSLGAVTNPMLHAGLCWLEYKRREVTAWCSRSNPGLAASAGLSEPSHATFPRLAACEHTLRAGGLQCESGQRTQPTGGQAVSPFPWAGHRPCQGMTALGDRGASRDPGQTYSTVRNQCVSAWCQGLSPACSGTDSSP